MERKINWYALVAGIITLVVLVLSIFMPWWQLTIGRDFFTVYASPINVNFGLNGVDFNIPLIWAWNLSNILMFTAAGIIMLIYAVLPTKGYSKELLGFAWKKPLYAVLSFSIGLIIIFVAASFFNVSFPLMGSSIVDLKIPFLPISAQITTPVTAGFLIPFWLAIAAAVLCVAARIYHGKMNPKPKTVAATDTTGVNNPQPAPEAPPPPPPQAPAPASP